MNASGLVALSAAANHLSGWGAFDWFFHVAMAFLGWILVAVPIYLMHWLETRTIKQPPPPAAPVTAGSEWEYYGMAVCSALGGAILGATFGWITARHIANGFLVFTWWMVPFICCGAVTMYWFVQDRPTQTTRSRSGWAVAVAALIYATVGILILGADLITRLAAQASLSSDALIGLLLAGVLVGWALWLFNPRRRAKQ